MIHIHYVVGVDKSSLLETDNVLTSYYEACAAAGPELCPLYSSTADQIRARVDKLVNDVHLRPISVYDGSNPSNPAFGVVDYTVVTQQLMSGLYFPYATGVQTATEFVQLENGNGQPIYAGSNEAGINSLDTCQFQQPFVAELLDISAPIVCGDTQGRGLKTFEESRAALDELVETSPFGHIWYNTLVGPCS